MRIEKVNELIKQELGKILLENIEFEPGVMVTVTACDTAKNLGSSKVFVSVLPPDKEDYILDILNREIGSIQSILNKRLNLKFVPKIIFRIDKSGEYVSGIEKVFEKIKDEE